MEKFVVSIERHELFNILVEANDEDEAENIVDQEARVGALEFLHTKANYSPATAFSRINKIIEMEDK